MSIEDLSPEGKSKQATALCRRRAFIAAALAFIAPSVMKAAEDVESLCVPRLKVGIVSDTHVAFRWQKEKLAMLKTVLRMFDAEKVDAVMMPGDIAESPIESFELLAETYFEVFPDDKGRDGRHVERLFVTGNHDLEEWHYGKKKDETLEQCIERWRDKAFVFHREEAESKALLAECEAIVKARDQKKVDAWRLAIGRVLDSLMAK